MISRTHITSPLCKTRIKRVAIKANNQQPNISAQVSLDILFEVCCSEKTEKIRLLSLRVYLGVRTCEVVICFVTIMFVLSIVLTSLFSLFYVTRERNRFLHRGWKGIVEPLFVSHCILVQYCFLSFVSIILCHLCPVHELFVALFRVTWNIFDKMHCGLCKSCGVSL